MAHEAHESSHDNPGVLGGMLDGTAIGLGSGVGVCGILFIAGQITLPIWAAGAAVTAIIGAIGGSIWGKNRGY
jgi:hypothetical protein